MTNSLTAAIMQHTAMPPLIFPIENLKRSSFPSGSGSSSSFTKFLRSAEGPQHIYRLSACSRLRVLIWTFVVTDATILARSPKAWLHFSACRRFCRLFTFTAGQALPAHAQAGGGESDVRRREWSLSPSTTIPPGFSSALIRRRCVCRRAARYLRRGHLGEQLSWLR